MRYCVMLALFWVSPDLVLSGINRGGNLGDDLTYSGTVAGALELRSLGLRQAMAGDKPQFRTAERYACV